MCGFVGLVAEHPSFEHRTRALETLSHRGPDGSGEFTAPRVWLGHRRLSIIDLSTGGAQPMSSPAAGTLVFNGELYDHVEQRRRLEALGEHFDSSSDTEVLLRGLAREGRSFLSGLHGMYAFAWLGPDGRTLLLGRDHAGMKPLYYAQNGTRLAFASEVRTLGHLLGVLGESVRPNLRALAGFLSFGSVAEPETILEGVQALPAGSVLAIDVQRPGEARVQRFNEGLPAPSATSVTASLRAAVQRHLVSDRPVALFLSGGIDSGVLAIEAARAAGPRPAAISVTLGTQGSEDEPRIVRALCERLDLTLHNVELSDWKDRLRNVWDAFDQPCVDGTNTFIISSAARELGYPVALSGVGADEVFGGYPHLRWQARLGRTLARLGRLGGTSVPTLLLRTRHARLRRCGFVLDAAARRAPIQSAWRQLQRHRDVVALFQGVIPTLPTGSDSDALVFERETYLRDTLLRDTDVMGMAHSLEIRAPFLDPDVLAAARAVGSPALLARSSSPKWPLREAWGPDLEPETLSRRKSGFVLDISAWLKERESERLRDSISFLSRCRAIHRPTFERIARDAVAALDSPRPTAWVPAMAIIQLARTLERWGEP